MASLGQTLFFIGIVALAIAVKWKVGIALAIGFVALIIPCLIPIIRFLFRPYR